MTSSSHQEIDSFSDLIPQFDQQGINLGLERMNAALQLLENPCSNIPAIQIVGTNGKGSIASFLESCLANAGISNGVTISPHLISWCERIRTNGEIISSQEFRRKLVSLSSLAKSLHLTPFELVMAVAFSHFAENQVELLVLEVGLGGRLDATTAHPSRPIIAMANIGIDHREFLGQTRKEIAQEKAAVISSGCKVISAEQHPEVKDIIEQECAKKKAQIEWVTALPLTWDLGLKGNFQRANAAVARKAMQSLERLGWQVEEQAIIKGLANAKWPGRFQEAKWQHFSLIIDGAHNPLAAKILSEERLNWPNETLGVHWILAIQSHKQAPEMIRTLVRAEDTAWIVPVPNHKSWCQKELSKACPELSKQIFAANSVEEVLSDFLKKQQWPINPPVITGSLFLIGSMLSRKIITTETFY